ncbi:MAG: ribosome biogenesis GTP-binding protein YihA/YsxC [Clostridia bacterium]|nr:ribosome biogenesis GTP-binding protein YihA/YsxC [Clostridia bacterium]
MRILSAEYETSVVQKKIYQEKVPEIAIAGRSNVGKSSFINMLTNRKKLARSSSEPGRTRMLNYFNINKGEFYLVDLPGYGYAKVTDKEKDSWKEIIEFYLRESKALKHVVLLVDIRHDPSPLDLSLAEYFRYYDLPFTVVATKADKLSKMNRKAAAKKIADAFSLPVSDVFVASSFSGEGRNELLSHLSDLLQAD